MTFGRAPQKGKFFVIYPCFWPGGGFQRIEIANDDRIMIPGTYIIEPPNGDPSQCPERPHLVHVPKKGKKGALPRDFENIAGQWIVSDASKSVFESVDPEGGAFAACDFTLADGSSGPQLYFCDVMRTLDALDEEASRLKIKIGDYVNGKYYRLAGGAWLIFRRSAVGSAHIFCTPFAGTVFCDRAMRNAIRTAKLNGVKLTDATVCS